MKNLNRTNLIAVRALLVGTLGMLTGEKVVKLKDVKAFAFEYLDKLIAGETDKEAAGDISSVRGSVSASGQRVTLERSLRFMIRRIDTHIDELNAAADKLQSAIDAPAAQPSMIKLDGNRKPRQTIDDVIGELDDFDKAVKPVKLANMEVAHTRLIKPEGADDVPMKWGVGVTTQKMLDDGAAVHEQAGRYWKEVARLNVPVAVAREIAFTHRDSHHCAMHDLVIASAQNIVKKLYVGIASAQCEYLFNHAKAQAPNKVELFEKAIIKALLEDVLAAGCAVVVGGPNGPEHNDPRTDFDKIWPELFAQDFEHLIVYGPRVPDLAPPLRRRYGFISLVYGNGEDVISDYTVETEIERLQVRASQVAEMIRAVEYADA